MNEVPPVSENFNLNPDESSDSQPYEAKVETRTENFDDVWQDEISTENFAKSERESQIDEAESAESNIFALESPRQVDDLIELSAVSEASEQETEIIERDSTAESPQTELFVDSWLDEPEPSLPANTTTEDTPKVANQEIDDLLEQKATLRAEIEELKAQKEKMLIEQTVEIQRSMAQIVEEGTKELKERKTGLQIEIEKLERRRDRINQEMRANFAGSSQELAVKVQGFKEYLVGSLQDLARAADKLDLTRTEVSAPPRSRLRNTSRSSQGEGAPSPNFRDERGRSSRSERNIRDGDRSMRSSRDSRGSRERSPSSSAPQGQFSEPTFADRGKQIRQLIDKYRNNPDYYGAPWQLRRTFEPIHAKRVQDWFFVQGGRGAVDSMGSRLQNILVASATISILHSLYGDRCRVLVLTDTPENLGEWRRGLQDCLGISRSNFGSNRGVTLFDAPEVAVQRAERLIEEKLLPIIVIDETEELLNLSVLKFPLWLAFASTNKQASANYLY
ncbi:MAG: DUF3086 domain-containing protein [Cyanobacteria bacterium P01_G01_bin.19]